MATDEKTVQELYGSDFVREQQSFFEGIFRGSGYYKRVKTILEFSFDHMEGTKVLDLGCGVGTLAIILAQKGFYTIGLDLSEHAIKQAKENAEKLNVWNIDFVVASSDSSVFQPNSFDVIIAADIFEHLPPGVLEQTLMNCYAWLRPRGVLVIHTFPTLYYPLTLDKSAFLLLPLIFLPRPLIPSYLRLIRDYVLDMLYLLVKRQRYSEIVAKSVHCNPQHPFKFKELLMKVGFEIVKYELLEEPLSGLESDKPRYKFCWNLIKKHDILKPSILAIAKKV